MAFSIHRRSVINKLTYTRKFLSRTKNKLTNVPVLQIVPGVFVVPLVPLVPIARWSHYAGARFLRFASETCESSPT